MATIFVGLILDEDVVTEDGDKVLLGLKEFNRGDLLYEDTMIEGVKVCFEYSDAGVYGFGVELVSVGSWSWTESVEKEVVEKTFSDAQRIFDFCGIEEAPQLCCLITCE